FSTANLNLATFLTNRESLRCLPMTHQLDRRSFIVATGLTALASTRVLGANDTIRVGVIGAGGRMNGLIEAADKSGANYQIAAVIIASPDHWHVRMAVDAIAAGKDVYLEKPVTHTVEEGATLTRAVRSSKQILQCGMQQRSWSHFRDAVDLIQGGSLGRVPQVRTYWWQNYLGWREHRTVDVQSLDWKQWL